MATYFHHGSSETQAPDGLQTLYLMNPNNYVQTYSDNATTTQPQPAAANMFILNTAAPTANHLQPHLRRHLTGVPLPSGSAAASGSNNLSHNDENSACHGVPAAPGHFHYNLWDPIDHHDHHHQHHQGGSAIASTDFISQMGAFRKQVISPTTQQALWLSLSSSQQAAGYATSLSRENEVVPGISPTSGDGHIPGFPGNPLSSTVSAVSNNGIGTSTAGVPSVLLGSRYLKATQELLDEVVNVGSKMAIDLANGANKKALKANRESTPPPAIGGSHNSGVESSSSKQIGAEISTAQRQELQVKKAKLASMLDEVIS